MHERGDELYLLLHPLGEFLHFFLHPSGDFQALAPGLSFALGAGAIQTVQTAKQHQVLQDLHPLIQATLFRQVSNALQVLAAEGLTKEPDLTRIWKNDADHHSYGTGLARSVWPQ